MDVKTLPEMLEELLHDAGDDGIEVCLSHAATVPPAELSAVCEEYEQRYARAVRAMCQERGVPAFSGRPTDQTYPAWHRAQRLSYWSLASGCVYVALCEEMSSVRLVAGARPHPFGRDTITLLPPAS